MASVKIKFRPSTVEGKEGTIYYQVIHDRMVKQINPRYKLYCDEWDTLLAKIVHSPTRKNRKEYLLSLEEKIVCDTGRLCKILSLLNRRGTPYTVADVLSCFREQSLHHTLSGFMESITVRLKQLGKVRTVETYTTTLNSFMRFRSGEEIGLDEIDSDLMMEYQIYLKSRNIAMNTISFYMRILRAVYNRAVEKELTGQRYPFRHVYTGIEKTVKRAVSFAVIKQIKELNLSLTPSLDYARNMFLFSLYTRGMSFVDMAHLKKTDLKHGILSYRRRKTGQLLFIKWEKCMQEVVDKYPQHSSPYLLSLSGRLASKERREYRNALALINRRLKEIGERLGLSRPLTMYVARHSWASIARSRKVPLSVISEGMGHDSETTTQIYLASLDTAAVDRANRIVLKGL